MGLPFSRAIAAVTVFALGLQTGAFAQTSSAALLAPPKPDGKPGSAFLQCDGQPKIITVGEALADVVLITGTLGLFHPGERGDVNKRLEGEPGVVACDRALTENTTSLRKAQLVLARAIHHIEAKQYDAALADLETVATTAGAQAEEPGFKESLGLTTMELRAAVLVREGKAAEASQVAMSMAAAAPYDVNNLARAQRYLLITPNLTADKAQYLDQLVKMMPEGLVERSSAHEWAGDFAAAADDMAALIDLDNGVWPDQAPPIGPTIRRSIQLALAGDVAQSDALANAAQGAIDSETPKGKIDESQASNFQESLDFRGIAVLAAKGQFAQARAAFKSRSRWLGPWAPEVAYLTEKLRLGAPSAELTGALARDPDEIRAEALETYIAHCIGVGPEREANQATLYGAVRPYINSSDYRPLGWIAWQANNSRLLHARTGKEFFQGEMITMIGQPPNQLVPESEAILLHAAVIAKARGVQGFVIVPKRQRLDTIVVRFGNAGDPGFPKTAFLEEGRVIENLSLKFSGHYP